MSQQGVVLLHGICRTYRSMATLERFLQRQGFATLNIDYPSRLHDLGALADLIHPVVAEFSNRVSHVHFVGHSMGGLLIRTYLSKYRPEHIGRVVMLGTPNNGSEVADYIRNWPLYKKIYGSAGQQLTTDQNTFSHLFGEIDYDVGVIAGNRAIDFIGSRIIGKPNDGKVSTESAKLPGMKDYIVLPASHSFMPQNRKLWPHVLSFLQQGNFIQ